MNSGLPPLARLLERFFASGDDPPDLLLTCALNAVPVASEAERVLQYLQGLGVQTSTLSNLVEGLRRLEDEEELTAFECQEGVAITHASDGWWLLFVEAGA